MLEIPRWSLILKAFFEGAVEPLQLAQGLRVIGRRVDQLDTEIPEIGFEGPPPPGGVSR